MAQQILGRSNDAKKRRNKNRKARRSRRQLRNPPRRNTNTNGDVENDGDDGGDEEDGGDEGDTELSDEDGVSVSFAPGGGGAGGERGRSGGRGGSGSGRSGGSGESRGSGGGGGSHNDMEFLQLTELLKYVEDDSLKEWPLLRATLCNLMVHLHLNNGRHPRHRALFYSRLWESPQARIEVNGKKVVFPNYDKRPSQQALTNGPSNGSNGTTDSNGANGVGGDGNGGGGGVFFATGDRVTVVGTSRDELNGLMGTINSLLNGKGRYEVALDDGSIKSLKPINLVNRSNTNGMEGAERAGRACT